MLNFTSVITLMAQNSLLCADVPLRNYSLTHFPRPPSWIWGRWKGKEKGRERERRRKGEKGEVEEEGRGSGIMGGRGKDREGKGYMKGEFAP